MRTEVRVNKNEKYQIRLLALVLAGLLAASVVFLIGTYRSALAQQQQSVLDQMQLVGAFVADNVDLESFRTVADAWSTGKGVSSPAAQ